MEQSGINWKDHINVLANTIQNLQTCDLESSIPVFSALNKIQDYKKDDVEITADQLNLPYRLFLYSLTDIKFANSFVNSMDSFIGSKWFNQSYILNFDSQHFSLMAKAKPFFKNDRLWVKDFKNTDLYKILDHVWNVLTHHSFGQFNFDQELLGDCLILALYMAHTAVQSESFTLDKEKHFVNIKWLIQSDMEQKLIAPIRIQQIIDLKSGKIMGIQEDKSALLQQIIDQYKVWEQNEYTLFKTA